MKMCLPKLATILLITCTFAALLHCTASRSFLGLGARIPGDHLLMRDVQQARPGGLSHKSRGDFNYIIAQQITYIGIEAEENVYADVSIDYKNNNIKGSLVATNLTIPFKFEITIYGFNETRTNLYPGDVLNRDQTLEYLLRPQTRDDYRRDPNDDQNTEDEVEDVDPLNWEELQDDQEEDEVDEDDEGNLEDDLDDDLDSLDDDFDEDDLDYDQDKVIEVGHRQNGDYLLYETYQSAPKTMEKPTNISVIFYYIDSTFVTYVKFVVFDHLVDETAPDYTPPSAEYSHFSQHTLKAVITDYKATSLVVEMFVYGYRAEDLPVGYEPFLTSSSVSNGNGRIGGIGENRVVNAPTATDGPLSPIQRLRQMLNAEQSHELVVSDNGRGLQTTRMETVGDDVLQRVAAGAGADADADAIAALGNVLCMETASTAGGHNAGNAASSGSMSTLGRLSIAAPLGVLVITNRIGGYWWNARFGGGMMMMMMIGPLSLSWMTNVAETTV